MGTKKSTEEVETTVDPKGLLNKSNVKSHSEHKVDPDGDYTTTKTIKHADGTEEQILVEKNTPKHWTNDGTTTTTTLEREVDPSGLGNKTKVELKEKVEVNPDGTGEKTIVKKVNGSMVSEETQINR